MVPITVLLGHDAATSCEPQRKGKTMSATEKNTLITLALAKKISQGMSARDAWESLFGEGSWLKFAGQIHDALNAKQ